MSTTNIKIFTKMAKRLSLKQQANLILKKAEERGVSQNYFFRTTFERYRVQLKILDSLEKAMAEHGTMVDKEYVKGRKNLTTNPAIADYNRTATAANSTVSTLIGIIKSFSDEDEEKSKLTEFMDAINAAID